MLLCNLPREKDKYSSQEEGQVMSLSTNQKITLSIAGFTVVLSFIFSSFSLYFSWDQKTQSTTDRISRCNDMVAQFQSDLSTKSDGILKEATNIRLGSEQSKIQIDDLLIEYRRFVRLFEKKQTCSSPSSDAIQKLTSNM